MQSIKGSLASDKGQGLTFAEIRQAVALNAIGKGDMMGWTDRTSSIQEADTVAYSKRFLQSTGQLTGDAPLAHGKVTGLVQLGSVVLAEIDWGGIDLPARVNVKNLSRVKDGIVMEPD